MEPQLAAVERAQDTLRLFVGIELDEGARDAAAAAIDRLRKAGIAARFEDRENLHITVAFLGAVESTRLETIVATLRSVRAAPFRLRLERVGAFPSLSCPRVIWLGPARFSAGFAHCTRAVRSAYAAQGFLFDDDVRPHLTLGRIRGPHVAIAAAALPPYRLFVTTLALFASRSTGGSTRYELLARQALSHHPLAQRG